MQKISLKARALRFLSVREHSRVELAKKLARYADQGDDLDALLDLLEAAQWLSDERFSESLVHRRIGRFGNARIVHELREHGIGDSTIAGIQAQLTEDEAARALDVWRRKFERPPADAVERAKQMRFLQQRGFSHGAIRFALRTAAAMAQDETDED